KLILRLLAKSPEERPQTADEVAEELDQLFAQSERLTRRFAAGTLRRWNEPTTRALPYPLRRRRRLGWLAVATGVLLAGGAAFLVMSRRAPAPAPPPPAQPAFVVEKPKQVRLTIESQPPGAQVVRADGSVAGTTPFSDEVLQSDEVRRYTLKLGGYVDGRVELPASADAPSLVPLVAEAPPPAPAPTPRVKPKKPKARPEPAREGDGDPVDPFH